MKILKKIVIFSIIVIILLNISPIPGHCERDTDTLKAFFLSFAVPGLGQYYAGSPGYAKLFVATELAIWAGYYYNSMMKDARSQDYYSYSALHAGVNPTGFKTSYLNAIGAFDSSFDHNAYKQQTAANPVLYYGDQSWEWDSHESRIRFRSLRERELDYENNIKYCIAGVVLNHFLSGLHASKLNGGKPFGTPAVTIDVLDNGLKATLIRGF